MKNIVSFPATPNVCELNSASDNPNWNGLRGFINDEISELEKAASILTERIETLTEIDLSDDRLKTALKLASVDKIAVDDLIAIWNKIIEPERLREERESALHWATFSRSTKLQYFTITNQRGSVVHLLADNAEVARRIAWSNDRIKSKDGGNLRKFDENSIEKLAYGIAIQRALSAGFPGELDIMGNSAVHKSRKMVFGPT